MKKFYYLGLCGLLAAAFTACKDDVVNSGNGGSIADMDGETGYVTFKIKSSQAGSMTRAWFDSEKYFDQGEEEDGNFADEYQVVNNVQANRVFFFDENGKYHSASLLTLEEGGKHEDDGHTGADSWYGDEEVVYSTTVRKTSDRGVPSWPSQCLVVLNGRPSRLNALIIKAQEEEDFNMESFLSWLNEDFRDTDADTEGETLGLYKYGNKYYFTMTNSIYWNNGATNGAELCNSTKITEDNLKMTREDAADNPVTVYVERIMSKVQVGFIKYDDSEDETTEAFFDAKGTPLGFLYSFSDEKEGNSTWIENDNEGSEDNQTTVKLKALITNWTVNAVEYQTKLFKDVNFATGETAAVSSTSYGETDPFEGWNDFSHHRSYWARDGHYEWGDGSEYPTQYRTAFDGKATSYQDKTDGGWDYGKETAEKGGNDIFGNYPWALDYKSYNAVVNKRKYKYCLENTFALTGSGDEGYKHMIMGSHVLIQALLLTEEEAKSIASVTKLEDLKVDDKYYYSDAYYDETSYIHSRVTRINHVLGENVGPLTVDNLKMWEKDTDGGTAKFSYEDVKGGLWISSGNGKYQKIVAHVEEGKEASQVLASEVFSIAPAYVAKGDGKVTIALKSSGKENDDDLNGFGYGEEKVNVYYFPYNTVDEATGQPVDPNNTDKNTPHQFTRNELVSLIYQIAGTADCFKGGRMYYTIPIQHHLAVGYGQLDADSKEKTDYEYKYTGLKTGDYGVVRNHWYKFTVNTVLKPGIPVHDPSQPIIPNYDDEDRYIGLEVVILPWHVINNGNVTLGQNK